MSYFFFVDEAVNFSEICKLDRFHFFGYYFNIVIVAYINVFVAFIIDKRQFQSIKLSICT